MLPIRKEKRKRNSYVFKGLATRCLINNRNTNELERQILCAVHLDIVRWKRSSCKLHFQKKYGKKFKCDVLASERRPSYFKVSQLPNFQLINPLQPGVAFSYLLKTSENIKNSVKKMQWSSSVTRVYFFMESETFGKVAFRGAYKAKSEDRQFRNKQWEIKRYIDPQNDILQVRDSFFQHTQEQVQARKLA